MANSGIPDEFPDELKASFAVKQARKEQNQLLKKLGSRLGINAITNSAAQSVNQFGDTKNIGAEKKHKLQEKREGLINFRLKGVNS